MADLYSHYTGVEPGSIKSATASLRSKVKTAQGKLSTFKSSLGEDVWKATAKETLFKAFTTLDTEVYKEILDKLDKADEIADYITKYNSAKKSAEGYKSNLSNATDKTPQSSINSWQQGLTAEENTMKDCVSSINGLL